MADGDIQHEVVAEGPAEIRQLGVRRGRDAPRDRPAARRGRAGPGPDRGGPRGARDAGGGAGPVQPRPGAVRLRRLPRPAGAAAQGGELLPDARAALQRPARRARRPVHRLRRRRREADAAADQRPARVLPGRPDRATGSSRSTLQRLPRRARSATWARHRRQPVPRSSSDPLPTVPGERGLLVQLLPEPDRQRHQVPRRRAAPRSTSARPGRATAGSSPARTTGSGSSRSTPTGSSSSSSGCTAARSTPAPASASPCARGSSSTTAAGSGSTPTVAPGATFRWTLPVRGATVPQTLAAPAPSRQEASSGGEPMTMEDVRADRGPARRGRSRRRADDPGGLRRRQGPQPAARRQQRRRRARVPAQARASTPTRRRRTWSCST